MTNPNLPLELIELIVHILSDSSRSHIMRTHSLAECSLVSRSFRSVCRRLLFADIEIPNERRCRDFYDLISQSDIHLLVKNLHILDRTSKLMIGTWIVVEESCLVPLLELMTLKSKLLSFELSVALRFYRTGAGDSLREVTAAIQSLLKIPSITTVSLQNSLEFFRVSELAQSLKDVSAIKHLFLKGRIENSTPLPPSPDVNAITLHLEILSLADKGSNAPILQALLDPNYPIKISKLRELCLTGVQSDLALLSNLIGATNSCPLQSLSLSINNYNGPQLDLSACNTLKHLDMTLSVYAAAEGKDIVSWLINVFKTASDSLQSFNLVLQLYAYNEEIFRRWNWDILDQLLSSFPLRRAYINVRGFWRSGSKQVQLSATLLLPQLCESKIIRPAKVKRISCTFVVPLANDEFILKSHNAE